MFLEGNHREKLLFCILFTLFQMSGYECEIRHFVSQHIICQTTAAAILNTIFIYILRFLASVVLKRTNVYIIESIGLLQSSQLVELGRS